MAASLRPDDPLDLPDWLYQRAGLLYGPVTGRALLDKVEAGELGADTVAARDGEPFRRLSEIPLFMVQVARVEARLRVEAQAREAARARRRRRLAWIGGVLGAGGILGGGAVAAVLWAENRGLFGPDQEALAALEIHVSAPQIRLQVVAEREEELVDYAEDPEKPGKAVASASGSRAPRGSGRKPGTAGSVEPDGLQVEAQYDQASIQAVIAREQQSLFPCLKDEARRDPAFRGDLPFTFTIGNDGRIVKLWIDRPGLESGPLQSCMQERMARWRFPAFEGERPSVSLSFRVGA